MSPLIKFGIILITCITSCNNLLSAQEKNYRDYYININKADSLYFIENKYTEGLQLYKETLSQYEFVWVHDCIRVAQLAIINQQKGLALFFMKKAIDNGFELGLIQYLNLGCVCNFYEDKETQNKTLNKFIEQNKKQLQGYYHKVRPEYIKSINKSLLAKILYDHVTDEHWKVNNAEIDSSLSESQKDEFHWDRHGKIVSENIKSIEKLFEDNVWIGERNLGRYTLQLMTDLNMQDSSIESIASRYINQYELKGTKGPTLVVSSAGDSIFILGDQDPIPVVGEEDYFWSSAYFITLHHGGVEAVRLLTRYKDTLINGGYIHPREYAYLASLRDKTLAGQLLLHPYYYIVAPTPTTYDNKVRETYLLPSFEIDKAKHEYVHKHNIKLLFGFMNCSR